MSMPEFSNRLRRTLSRLDVVPGPLRAAARTLALGRAIRFVGTAGAKIDRLEELSVAVTIPDRVRVHNHIGGLHAAALALAAETATGLAVGMNVHDGAVPVLKSMRVDYQRRAAGGVQAVATLTRADAERMRADPRGEVTVPVVVTDESGEQPIECEMQWAWTPRRAS